MRSLQSSEGGVRPGEVVSTGSSGGFEYRRDRIGGGSMGSLVVMVTNHQWGHTCLMATTNEKDERIGIG